MNQLSVFTPSPSETLAERCARLAGAVADYELDITNAAPLDLTAVRVTLIEASEELRA